MLLLLHLLLEELREPLLQNQTHVVALRHADTNTEMQFDQPLTMFQTEPEYLEKLSLFKQREVDQRLGNVHHVLQAEVILTSKQRVRTFGLEGHIKDFVTKRQRVRRLQTFPVEQKQRWCYVSVYDQVPPSSVCGLQRCFLHQLKGVWRCSDEEASGLQALAGVPQHHVGLLLALKRVMVHKLTAADVKHQRLVVQLLRQNHL